MTTHFPLAVVLMDIIKILGSLVSLKVSILGVRMWVLMLITGPCYLKCNLSYILQKGNKTSKVVF